MNNCILDNLLDENDVIMLDTCFAMRDEFLGFIDSIEIELMTRRKKIVVKSVVMAELFRLLGAEDKKICSKATNAVSTICMKRNIFDIDEKNISTEAILKAFVDVELFTDFAKNRIKYRMALLTNDYNLGKDIIELNNLGSCYGKKIEVFSLNKYGCLEEKVYEEVNTDTNISGNSVTHKSEVEIKNDNNINWKHIVISAFTSFAMGVFVDKYGKKFIHAVSKVVA